VDLIVHIKEGPQFLFGKLTIEGLDLNAEAAIRKMWNMKEGKPYNGDYPDLFLNRVREEGIFDNLKRTRAAQKINEQDRTVDVTLYFNEPPPKLPPGVLPPQQETDRRGP
jgi:outer membrane translocation and assembly module TamA